MPKFKTVPIGSSMYFHYNTEARPNAPCLILGESYLKTKHLKAFWQQPKTRSPLGKLQNHLTKDMSLLHNQPFATPLGVSIQYFYFLPILDHTLTPGQKRKLYNTPDPLGLYQAHLNPPLFIAKANYQRKIPVHDLILQLDQKYQMQNPQQPYNGHYLTIRHRTIHRQSVPLKEIIETISSQHGAKFFYLMTTINLTHGHYGNNQCETRIDRKELPHGAARYALHYTQQATLCLMKLAIKLGLAAL